jgi:hypothetical protein
MVHAKPLVTITTCILVIAPKRYYEESKVLDEIHEWSHK